MFTYAFRTPTDLFIADKIIKNEINPAKGIQQTLTIPSNILFDQFVY